MSRKTDYRREYCDRVLALGKEGQSTVQIAANLGVCRQTIDNWRRKFPEFDEAMRLSLTYQQAWWETFGLSNMGNRTFNSAMYIKTMQARFKGDWTERKELSGPDGRPIAPAITKIELVAAELPKIKNITAPGKNQTEAAVSAPGGSSIPFGDTPNIELIPVQKVPQSIESEAIIAEAKAMSAQNKRAYEEACARNAREEEERRNRVNLGPFGSRQRAKLP